MERQGMIGRRTLLAGLAASLAASPARSLPHGWNNDSLFGQWVAGLKRPDMPTMSCCGKGDLYSIVIDEDAIGDTTELMGRARVLDGSPREFPDGTFRVAIPDGTEFRFPKKVVNKPKDGSPGPTAWAFIAAVTGEEVGAPTPGVITGIYCVIPLPGAA